MITYTKGNCLQDSNKKRIIVHLVNNKGGFGAGFALNIGNKYPVVRKKYKDWYHSSILNAGTDFQLGNIQIAKINNNLTFINMLAQNGYKTKKNPIPLNYYALQICLDKVKQTNKNNTQIWMPKIGSGLTGGNWNYIEGMINDIFKDTKIMVFEL